MHYLDPQYGMSGVYAILNVTNGKVYVGSAVDIKRRWIRHVHRLRLGTHTNPILQAAWDKHGEANFDFVVLEEVPDHIWLMIREQLWLNEVQPHQRENGYNILPTAESRLGHTESAETRRKKSVATTRAKLGKPLSKEHCLAVAEAHQGKPWSAKRRKAVVDRAFMDADWRAAISARTVGKNNPFFGKTHPPGLKSALQRGQRIAAHKRWHLNRGVVNPSCDLCQLGVS